MTTCIVTVSTGLLFYDCSNVLFAHVYFRVWRIGNHLLTPFNKIVARIQYFGRKCNPETHPNVREVFTTVTMKTVVCCDIMQFGRSSVFCTCCLSSGQLCAFGSVMLQFFFLLFPVGSSACGYIGDILCLGLEWTKLDYDGWTLGIVWKMHHYCWVQCTIITQIWCDVWWNILQCKELHMLCGCNILWGLFVIILLLYEYFLLISVLHVEFYYCILA